MSHILLWDMSNFPYTNGQGSSGTVWAYFLGFEKTSKGLLKHLEVRSLHPESANLSRPPGSGSLRPEARLCTELWICFLCDIAGRGRGDNQVWAGWKGWFKRAAFAGMSGRSLCISWSPDWLSGITRFSNGVTIIAWDRSTWASRKTMNFSTHEKRLGGWEWGKYLSLPFFFIFQMPIAFLKKKGNW